MAKKISLPRRNIVEDRLKDDVKIVLVCEGELTEPTYFLSYIKEHFRDPRSVHIEPNKNRNTDIMHLYKKALKKSSEFKNAAVFIVFDEDGKLSKPTEKACLTKVLGYCNLSVISKDKINSIISNRQFELWAILHFEYTTAQLVDLKDRVKRYFEKYDDNNKIIDYQVIKSNPGSEAAAMKNAQKLREFHNALGQDAFLTNPSTNVDMLIKYMQDTLVHRPS